MRCDRCRSKTKSPDEVPGHKGADEEDRHGHILREKRIACGMTQQQVAIKAQVHQQQYQKFESGKRNIMTASFQIVCRVLEALGMDIADFYHERASLSYEDSIGANTLADIDAAIVNLKEGNVSEPIDLSDF